MPFEIRFGTTDDTDILAELIRAAGEGIFEQLFEGIVPGLRAEQVLRFAVVDSTGPFSHANALVMEEEGRVVGTVLGYPAEDYALPPVAQTLVPSRRIKPLAELLASRLSGSFYINTVAVIPEARGRGVARMLVETMIEVAGQKGFSVVSLHAWRDSPAPQRLYAGLGFTEVEQISVPQTKYLTHADPIILMRTDVSEAHRGMAR